MQRNLMIRSLASSGHMTSDIHAKVTRLFGHFSTKTLERAMKR